uniref:Uncharacterized protein n=1 Tax=Hyaloperonospora arabidopsidis (strain Emoy2) TaxID=559515 RepID=M4B619_HYAAE
MSKSMKVKDHPTQAKFEAIFHTAIHRDTQSSRLPQARPADLKCANPKRRQFFGECHHTRRWSLLWSLKQQSKLDVAIAKAITAARKRLQLNNLAFHGRLRK